MTKEKSTLPIVTESTHGEFTITEAAGEVLSNCRLALMDRLFDVAHNDNPGEQFTVTGEELTNVAKAWLKYVQDQTDFSTCQLCGQKVNPPLVKP